MTLDCCTLWSVHFVQSRVISLLSWYLTSLVNLSFYSMRRSFFLHTFALNHCTLAFIQYLFSEMRLCVRIYIIWKNIVFRSSIFLESAFSTQQPSLKIQMAHWSLLLAFLDLLWRNYYNSNIHLWFMSCMPYAFSFDSIYIRTWGFTCTLVSPLVYKLAQEKGKINMGNYIKHTKWTCAKYRNPPRANKTVLTE